MKTKEIHFSKATMQEAFDQLPKLMEGKGWMNRQGIRFLIRRNIPRATLTSWSSFRVALLIRYLKVSGVPIEESGDMYRLQEGWRNEILQRT